MGNPKKHLKKAVALRYDREHDSSPAIVGKGAGLMAEKIIALAREHGIPIHPDSDLVEVLSRLNINENIPPDTYIMVAEILAFIYRTNQDYVPPQ
ncbi:MAG: FhlB domain-containing protein [Deltaproteobacteria bacterium]|nr:FhlB domain-containing protein [Deltaproteobacteria bacterium]